MKILLMLLLISNISYGATFLCDYKLFGAPFLQVEMIERSSGVLNKSATMIHMGNSKKVEAKQLQEQDNELYRFELKETTREKPLIVKIFHEEQNARLLSSLNNPNMPFGDNMEGSCSVTE